MSRSFKITSITVIILTMVWFFALGIDKHCPKWQFLTAGGIHFLMAIIINRQFVEKNINYLGVTHVICMILLGGYGYFFM